MITNINNAIASMIEPAVETAGTASPEAST